MPIFTISGQVIDQRSNAPVSGGTVTSRVYEKRPGNLEERLTQRAPVDAGGKFEFKLDSDNLFSPTHNLQYEVDFEVISSTGQRLPTSFKIDNLQPRNQQVTIPVLLPQPEEPDNQRRRVYGMIRTAYGEGLDGVTVRAYDLS